MSRRTIKPKKPNGHRKPILLSGVSEQSPFATLQNAVLSLARASGQAETNARVQAIFELLKAFEASFVEAARQLGAAERALIQTTGGEFHTFQFGGALPSGTKIRVLDSEGTPATIVDVQRGRFIKLPMHIDPMAIELTLPDGTVKTIVPGQPVRVAPSMACLVCRGSGRLLGKDCSACDGTGTVEAGSQATPLGCVHGRPPGGLCPWCSGINDPPVEPEGT